MQNEFSYETLKNKRIEKAVSSCAEMFLKYGIDAVRMTDIARESGVGVATIYRYFGTKTGITIAAMTYLWNQMREMFSGIFDSDVFLAQTGLKQLRDLMRMYIVIYQAHPSFMRVLSEFDLMITAENVPKEDLREYERSIINFYPVFEKSYVAGLTDGTVREVPDIQMFYLSFAHSLMELCKKLIHGELLPSDDFTFAEKELETVIDTAIYFLKKEE
ncbi:MAG: TetR/AcrR family transcriptional regulator [Ruminococcus sp.]|nr:TetR/AcrR family transcriptional regulator [Ruminococcus sp.]